jgi:predicted MPP superfamily phosphohydrolase
MPVTRRQFLIGLAGASAALASAPLYSRLIEPRWLSIHRARAPILAEPAGRPIRLLHLSDFHASDVVPLSFIAEAVRLGLSLKPDLVVITGDFMTRHIPDTQAYADVLHQLADAAPVFAVLGNHDGGLWTGQRGGPSDTEQVRSLLAASGISLLYNSSELITAAGQQLRLIGLGDLWAHELDAKAAFGSIPANEPHSRIVLSHNPDSKSELENYEWQLMLSGHTHGGQIYIPFLGAPLAPVADHRYISGLKRWGERWIAVTRGVGNLHGIRFNCRPEVSLLQFVHPSSTS